MTKASCHGILFQFGNSPEAIEFSNFLHKRQLLTKLTHKDLCLIRLLIQVKKVKVCGAQTHLLSAKQVVERKLAQTYQP